MAKEIFTQITEAQLASSGVPAGGLRPEHQAARVNFLSLLLERIRNAVKAEEKTATVNAARDSYARLLSETFRTRRNERVKIQKTLRFEPRPIQDSRDIIQSAWTATERAGSTPLRLVARPEDLEHSAVAAELVARIAVLPADMQADPRVVYREVARAYQSIDWKNITPQQEAELKAVIERSFAYIRTSAKALKLVDIPEDDTKLWRGMGDFYFSAEVSPDELQPDPAHPDQTITDRNTKRENLRRRLRELQEELGRPNSEKKETRLLEDAERDLEVGSEDARPQRRPARGQPQRPERRGRFTKEDVDRVRERRLREEIDQATQQRGGRGGGRVDGEPVGPALEDLQEEARRQEEEARRLGIDPATARGSKQAFGLLHEVIPEYAARLFPNDPQAQKRLLDASKEFWPTDLRTEALGISEDRFRSASSMLGDLMRREGLTPEQRRALEGFRTRVEGERQAMLRKEQPPNRIYMSEEQRIRFETDPIGYVDNVFNEFIELVLSNAGDEQVKVKLEELSLIQYYLFSDSFDSRIVRIDTPTGPIDEATKLALRERFTDKVKLEKGKFARSFAVRLHAAQWLEAWSNSDSTANENWQRFVNSRLNEEDFFGLDGLFGGGVARARQILRTRYIEKSFQNGRRVAYEPRFWKEAVDEAIAELRADRQYQGIYQEQYLMGEFFKDRPWAGDPSTLRPRYAPDQKEKYSMRHDKACEMIMRFAELRMFMSAEKDNLDIRFLPPRLGKDMDQLGSTFKIKQRIPKLMRPITHHFMTWGGFQSGRFAIEKAIIRHQAGILRYQQPEIDAWARERADRYWAWIERFRQGEFDGEAFKDERKLMFGELKSLFFFIPDQRDLPPEPNDAHAFGEWLRNVTYKQVLTESQVYSGIQIQENHMVRPYTMMFESGYRNSEERRAMKNALVPIFGSGEHDLDGIFDAGTVVEASNSYHMQKYIGDPPAARRGYIKKMADVAHTRPHDLVLALREGESRSLEAWERQYIGGARLETIYGDLSLRFEDIRTRLLGEFDHQIDYYNGYNGLSGTQRAVAEQAYQERYPDDSPADVERRMRVYFDRMQKLSQYLLNPEGRDTPLPAQPEHHEAHPRGFLARVGRAIHEARTEAERYNPRFGAIEEFADIRFAPIITKARWDDYPYEWLQYPERIMSVMDRKGISHKDIPPVADWFIGSRGEEQSGPFRRMHRDLGGAQIAFDQIGPSFDWDPKVRMPAQAKLYATIVGYQGIDHAAICHVMQSGGRLAAEKVYSGYGPFLEDWAGSSDMGLYKPGFKAKSVDELKAELENELSVAGGMIAPQSAVATGILEGVQGYLGITHWRRWFGGYHGRRARFAEALLGASKFDKMIDSLDERFPIGVKRMKVWAIPLVGIAFLVYYGFSTASKKEDRH